MNVLIRRILVALAVSLIVFGGTQLVSSAPAQAASFVTGCFKHTNGSAFHYTINLNYWANGRWTRVASQEGNYSGCVSWNISGWLRDYPLQMTVAYRVGTAYFYGTSPSYAPAGSARYSLGTGWVHQSGGYRSTPQTDQLAQSRQGVRVRGR